MNPNIYRSLGLSDEEYKQILKFHQREPTPTELAMFSVEWSEHCGYMCSKPHLSKFPKNNSKYQSLIGEDSGGVVIDDYVIIFKMESHNHPSEVIPYHGAATGVGGIIRDIFTTGARPIALLNSLRFGDLNDSHNQYIMKEVVRGISDYGNCVGIPTVGGEIYSDPSYNGNCLVNVMCIGIVKKDQLKQAKAKGISNTIMYVGASTGPDGIGGCSVLASQEFSENDDTKHPTVQIGNPFLEKCLIEATLELLQSDYVIGIKDMGAAGLTCSLVEMAAAGNVGMEIHLDKVPLRKHDMEPYEIMMSESQERMIVCIKNGHENKAETIFTKWGLNAVNIGKTVEGDRIKLFHKEEIIADISSKVLTNPPIYNLDYVVPKDNNISIPFKKENDACNYNKIIMDLLRHPNIASKRQVYQQYDYQVQTNTLLPPGSADAVVLRVKDSDFNIAATTDCNSTYCLLNPYAGSYLAVLEAARNIICVGADPVAVTDGLNFGNPKKKDRFYYFVKSIEGIVDACKELEVPVVSGNVSFYNENPTGPINPTPIIGMIGIMKNTIKPVQQYFIEENNVIILIGPTDTDMNYSEYLKIVYNIVSGQPPDIKKNYFRYLHKTMKTIIKGGLINSSHDCSEGGLSIALVECCFGNKNIGARINIKNDVTRHDFFLFSETQHRIVVSCIPKNVNKILDICHKYQTSGSVIGWTGGNSLQITHNEKKVIDCDVLQLKNIWENSFSL